MNFISNNNIHICLFNIKEIQTKYPNFSSMKGNACDLSCYRNKEFDVVFSNSVIEHLFTFKNQQKMAQDISRVGKYYFIQTPNFYFPIEPHWRFPFFQFLPFNMRVSITKHIRIGHRHTSNHELATKMVSEINLLTEKKMKSLFPDGKVYREILFGMVKSIILYRFPD